MSLAFDCRYRTVPIYPPISSTPTLTLTPTLGSCRYGAAWVTDTECGAAWKALVSNEALAYSEEGYANHLQSGTLPEGSDEDPEEGEADDVYRLDSERNLVVTANGLFRLLCACRLT